MSWGSASGVAHGEHAHERLQTWHARGQGLEDTARAAVDGTLGTAKTATAMARSLLLALNLKSAIVFAVFQCL